MIVGSDLNSPKKRVNEVLGQERGEKRGTKDVVATADLTMITMKELWAIDNRCTFR